MKRLLAVLVPLAGLAALASGLVSAQQCDPVTHPCDNHAYLPFAYRPSVAGTPTPLPLKDPYEIGNRCRESEIWRSLEINRTYHATISDRTDEDWFETVSLEPGVQYVLEMWPPAAQDYDVDFWVAESRTTCSLYTALSPGYNAGEGTPERIPSHGEFVVTEPTSLVVRVFAWDPSTYHTPHAYYRLRLSAFAPP